MKNYIDNIKDVIRSLDGSEIEDHTVDDQQMISFQIISNEKPLSIALFHRSFEEQGQLMLQLFTSFSPIYDEPGVDFYQVLERLNMNSIIGHIFFSREEEIFRISYKSNCLLQLNKENENIRIFLESSFLMMDDFEKKLTVM